MLSVNEFALEIVEEMIEFEEDLKIDVSELSNGARILDCGVHVDGSYSAGLMFTEVCMGGLGTTSLRVEQVNDVPLTFIDVVCDHAAIAGLGSQKAGWQINVGDYVAMGSGPARALALKPKKTYKRIEYEDDAEHAVIALESDVLPNEEVMAYIAESCGVDVSNTVALVAPTASIVGSVQVSGRVVETGIFRLNELGYDTRQIVCASGSAPVAPVVNDNIKAMGTTNDSVIYYGSVVMTVREFDEEIFSLVPSSTSTDYGKPFYETFKEVGFDFYKVDASIFAPASITVNDLDTGATYHMGELNSDVIMRSYGLMD
ncbi:MAG: methenyltetrahydromethanopterin cyclohydrolase [Methermicoccaceae archaeon]